MAGELCNDCFDTSQIVIPSGPQGDPGINGTNGTNGTNGLNGDFGGFSAEYIFDGTTGGAPTATFLKFNASVLSSVTSISINDLNSGSVNLSNFLNSFTNTSTGVNNYGLIRVWKKFSSNTFWAGKITNLTDLGSSVVLTVSHIESNGTFNTSDSVVISFAASGAVAGTDKEIVSANHVETTNSTTVLTSLASYLVPSNTLIANGDQLSVNAVFKMSTPLPSALQARIQVGSNDITASALPWILGVGIVNLFVNFTLTRTSSTTAFLNMQSFITNNSNIMIPSYANAVSFPFTSSTVNLINMLGLSADGLGNTIKSQELTIKLFNI